MVTFTKPLKSKMLLLDRFLFLIITPNKDNKRKSETFFIYPLKISDSLTYCSLKLSFHSMKSGRNFVTTKLTYFSRLVFAG